jgi:hypothetical protein
LACFLAGWAFLAWAAALAIERKIDVSNLSQEE